MRDKNSIYPLLIKQKITVLKTIGWYFTRISEALLSENRWTFLLNKKNQEEIVGALLACVATFRSGKTWYPSVNNEEKSSADVYVINSEEDGAAIQVTSTYKGSLDHVKKDVTDEIWKCILNKHAKGMEYSLNNHLAVFIARNDFQINFNKLVKKIRKEHMYWNYWIIAPIEDEKKCMFLVSSVFREDSLEWFQCVVDFTPPDTVKINYLSEYLKNNQLIHLDELNINK